MRGFQALATGLVLAVAPCTAAQAGPDDPSGIATSFRVEVRGSVSPRCGLVQSGQQAVFSNPASLDNKTRADEVSLNFDINCNTGFTFSLSSVNGGLKSSAWTSDQDFTNIMLYTATVSLPSGVRGPACDSVQMNAESEHCLKSVAGSALRDGVLRRR